MRGERPARGVVGAAAERGAEAQDLRWNGLKTGAVDVLAIVVEAGGVVLLLVAAERTMTAS
jgi:hypothetical protein